MGMGMGMGSRHAPSDAAAAFRFAQVLTPFWQAQITMDKRAFLRACTATTLVTAMPPLVHAQAPAATPPGPRHTLSGTTNDGGKPGNVTIKVLTVWQKEGSQWRLLARQAVRPT